jgi:RimJ/RimL family protein N-acetyltransferase
METHRLGTGHESRGAGVARSEALAWLAEVARENVGTEIVLRRSAELDVTLGLERDGEQLTGVGVLTDTTLFLEPRDGSTAATLLGALGRRARKLWVRGEGRPWLRGWAEANGGIAREHGLLVMRATRVPAVECAQVRWATRDDVPALEAYAREYGKERGTSTRRDWVAAVERQQVVVLEQDREVRSIVLRSGHTDRVACIGGTWTAPAHRREGLSRATVTFMMVQLLATHGIVQLVVDDDNEAAIQLYASLGFERSGRCYQVYRPKAP